MLKKWDPCFDELVAAQIFNVFKLSPFTLSLSNGGRRVFSGLLVRREVWNTSGV
ncbi:MAG TPA: hypothetical protein VLJ79_33395 [Candidatus Binatia bacterium]|nr:hypothetical protein [Candidatus Binatia bacterium]